MEANYSGAQCACMDALIGMMPDTVRLSFPGSALGKLSIMILLVIIFSPRGGIQVGRKFNKGPGFQTFWHWRWH